MRGIVAGLFALAVIGLPLLQSSAASANSIAGGGYSSSYAGESVFTNNAAGETGQMSAIFFNDGTQAWAPGVVGLLVCAADKTTCNVPSNQSFRSRWFSDRVYATVTSTVAPGQNGFFIYDFTVPAGTPTGTVTTFYGDVGLIATGAELRPEGYFQINTTPVPSLTLTLTPSPASVAVGSTQQFTLSGGPTGIDPSWSVTGGCGAITATGLFAATATNSASQPCTVVAKIAGTTASAVVTVYGPAAALSCVANPVATVANGGGPGGTGTITIALKDINGNTVSNASTPAIRIANNTPTLATVTPPDGLVTPSNGIVALTYTTTILPGTIQVSASATGVLGCNVMVASSAPGSGVGTASSFDPTIIASDGGSTSTLRVDVVDASGNRDVNDGRTVISVSRDSGANICTLSGGGGSATGTVVQGRATFTVVSTTTPGTCLWSATTNSSAITGSSATLTTQIVGAANRIGVVSNDSPHPVAAFSSGTCAPTGTNTNPSCTKVVVEVRDFNGVRLTGSTATLTATLETSSCTGAGGGSASAYGPTATATAGRATFFFYSQGAYSACNVTFSGTGLAGTNITVAWTPQAADHLACVFAPPSIFNDNTATSTADVAARDPFGNVVTGSNYSVTFTKQSGSSTVLVTASPQTMLAGHAYFTVRSTTTSGSDLYLPQIAPGGGALPNPPASCSVSVHP